MGSKNVIRQDIVQVGFLIQKSPVTEINRMLDKMKKTGVSAVDGIDDGFNELKSTVQATVKDIRKIGNDADGLDQMKSTVQDITEGMDDFGSSTDNVGSKIAETTRETKKMSQRIMEMVRSLTEINGSKIKMLPAILKSSAVYAREFASKLKAVTFRKLIDGMCRAANKSKMLFLKLKEIAHISMTKLVSGLRMVDSQLNKVAAKAKMAGLAVARGLGRGTSRLIRGTANGILAMGAGTVAAGAGMFKLSDMASDLSETANKIDVAFGKSAKTVMNWSGSSIKTMGLAKQTALDMAALYGDMGTSMGIPRKEMAGMSTNIVQLAADLASFKNIGTDQAANALNGIFTGETESLKGLGIIMNETELSAFALSQGISKSTKKMTQAEKVQLRYNYVMAKTTNAQGDFARTGGGFANQYRMLQEQIKEIGTNMGTIFIPSMTKGLNVLNDFGQEINGIFTDGWQTGDMKKITKAFDGLFKKITISLRKNLPKIIKITSKLISQFVQSFIQLIPAIVPALLQGFTQIIVGIKDMLVNNKDKLTQAFKTMGLQIITNLYEGITGKAMPSEMFTNLSTGFDSVITTIARVVASVKNLALAFAPVIAVLIQYLPGVLNFVGNLVSGFCNFAADNINWLIPVVVGLTAAFLVFKAVMFVVNTITAVHNAIQAIMGAKQLFTTATTVAQTTATVAQTTATVAQTAATAAQTTATVTQTTATWGLNAAFLACPVTWIIIAIIALVAIFVVLYNKCEWVRNAFNAVGDAIMWVGNKIGDFFGWIGDKLGITSKDAGKSGGEMLKEGWNEGSSGMSQELASTGSSALVSLDGGLKSGVPGLQGTTDNISNTIMQGLKLDSGMTMGIGADISKSMGDGINYNAYLPVGAAQSTQSQMTAAFNNAGQVTGGSDAINKMLADLQNGTPSVVGQADSLSNQVTSAASTDVKLDVNVSPAVQSLSQFNTTTSTVVVKVKASVKSLTTAVNANMKRISAITKTSLTQMASTFQSQFSKMLSTTRSTMSQIRATIAGTNLQGAGFNVMSGLNRGLLSGKGAVLSTARGIATDIEGTINKALAIHSPSKKLTKTGEFAGDGLTKGMVNKIPDIRSTAKDMSSAITVGSSVPLLPRQTSEDRSMVSGTTRAENNSYSPVFNLILSTNSSDVRTITRVAKKAVKDALSETFESMDRIHPRTREV